MSNTICIAFPGGGRLPKSITGEATDRRVAAREPVLVPETYGRHLIHDRFAVPAEMPKKEEQKMARLPADKGSPSRKASVDKVAAEKAAAEKAAAELAAAEKAAAEKAAAEKAAAEKAAAEKADAVKAAEDAVLAAMSKLEKVGDDMVAKAAAEDELKAAEAAFAALKA